MVRFRHTLKKESRMSGKKRLLKTSFTNTVKVEWPADETRDMVLIEELAFIDAQGKKWTATAGSRINGVSIPPILWSMVGSPFVGKSRRASVLHDVYCAERTEPYKAVHRMFYEAMLADGEETLRARLMYNATLDFGPRWDAAGNLLPSYIDEETPTILGDI